MISDIRCLIGVDIGGTFTDICVLATDGRLITKKILSTPEDYSLGIIAGISESLNEIGLLSGDVNGVSHATTVATNTILEKKGAKTALLTTEGFRDVLEMRRLRIPELYNLQYEKPPSLVPRRYRFEVSERMGPRGEVWLELDEGTLGAVIEKLSTLDFEALAICLIHSYVDSTHEQRISALVKEALGDDLYVTCSSEILPEISEYDRTSTTVVNAYIGPSVAKYIGSLVGRLTEYGISAPLEIIQSNGGAMTAAAAIRKPASIVESGPAAGVIAAARTAKLTGQENAISFVI